MRIGLAGGGHTFDPLVNRKWVQELRDARTKDDESPRESSKTAPTDTFTSSLTDAMARANGPVTGRSPMEFNNAVSGRFSVRESFAMAQLVNDAVTWAAGDSPHVDPSEPPFLDPTATPCHKSRERVAAHRALPAFVAFALLFAFAAAPAAFAQTPMSVRHINPDGLIKNPAFTQVVTVTGPATTVYVGGQDAVDASGAVVGRGDIGAQTAQVLTNLRTALAAAGAGFEHVVKWNVLVVAGQPTQPAFEAFQAAWGNRPNPPAITLSVVSALAHPDYLVEIDAIAVVPAR